jgi:protein-tyrosine phosphatase
MLPGIDDGPVSFEEALEMVKVSYDNGIRHIAMTSHLNHPLDFSGEDDYDGVLCDFKKLVYEKYPDLNIYKGAEVYISRNMLSEMDKINIRTINDTKYVLVEFARNIRFIEMDMAAHELKILGYTPVIAHVEEYHELREKYDEIRQLKDDGVVIQCNSGDFKKNSRYSRCVRELLKRNLVDIVASDCHNMDKRPPGLMKTYEFVKRKYGMETAERIFIENPERIIKGEKLPKLLWVNGESLSKGFSKAKIAVIVVVGIAVAAIYLVKGGVPAIDIEIAAGEDSVEPDVTKVDNLDISSSDDEITDTEKIDEDNLVDSSEEVEGNNSEEALEVISPEELMEAPVEANNPVELEKSHEELLVENYVSYLEDLEIEYIETCEGYYSMLKAAIDLEDETVRDEKVEEILDELGRVESRSDNQVYKTLYDMQNDLEEYKYDVALVKELREHYIEVKMEVSEEYKVQLGEYGNSNN